MQSSIQKMDENLNSKGNPESQLTEKETCTICNKQYKNKHTLYSHMRVHNDEDYNCFFCNKKLCSSYGLKRHQETCKQRINKDIKDIKKVNAAIKEKEQNLVINSLRQQLQESKEQILKLQKEKDILSNDYKQSITQVIQTKDQLYEQANKAHQVQTTLSNIQNSNSNNHNNHTSYVNVTNYSDVEIARIIKPISNKQIVKGCKETIRSHLQSNPNQFLSPPEFISRLMNTDTFRNNVIITDKSRNTSLWVNEDKNNQLILDKQSNQLVDKIFYASQTDQSMNEPINEILHHQTKLLKGVDTTDVEENVKACKESIESSMFLKSLVNIKKLNDKDKKKYGELLTHDCPDKSSLSSLSLSEYKEMITEEIKEKIKNLLQDEYMINCVKFIYDELKKNPHFACFIPLFQLGGYIRQCFDEAEQQYKSTQKWLENQLDSPQKIERIEQNKKKEPVIKFLSYNSISCKCKTTKGEIHCNKVETCYLFQCIIRSYFKNIFLPIASKDTQDTQDILSDIQKQAFEFVLNCPNQIKISCGENLTDYIVNYVSIHNWCYLSNSSNDDSFIDGLLFST